MTSPVIETIGLSKTYAGGVQALNSLNLKISKGESVGFLGPNGAGKTTTIQILLNLLKPSKGLVRLFDQPTLGKERELLQNVGALVGMPGYYSYLTAEDVLSYVGRVFEMERTHLKTQINSVLDTVGLSHAKTRKVGKFSTGMKRRLGIAQILLHDPELIILDEPTNGLDPKGVREVRDIISQINKTGKTIFMTTHNLTEVDELSKRVIFLNQGEMIGDQSLSNLRSQLGSKQIEVKFTQPLNASMEESILSIPNVKEIYQTDQIFVEYQGNGETTTRILEDLVNAELGLYSYRPVTLTLEDIYLRLYGENDLTTPANVQEMSSLELSEEVET